MKNRMVALACIVLIGTGVAFGKYSGGTGEPNDPYRIATAADLNDIGNHVEDFNKCFVMVNDINLADYTGTEFKIIGRYFGWNDPNNKPFTGVFDGNGHRISNFAYQCSDASRVGLFGYMDDADAEIRNVTLREPNLDGGTGDDVGALAGWLRIGTIHNCAVAGGSVSGYSFIGGLVGASGTDSPFAEGARITNCCSGAMVSGFAAVGGLVGIHLQNLDGLIANCSSTGTVSGSSEVGGLVGTNNGSVSDCYATGSVLGGGAYGAFGGLVGNHLHGTISKSYATGSVNADKSVGGLAGSSAAAISDSYAIGAVSADTQAGGLVGYAAWHMGPVTNCYAAGSVAGDDKTGGLVGYQYDDVGSYTKCIWDSHINPDVNGIGNTSDPNVIGKTTVEMRKESTFTDAGWDFVEVWGIGENQTYPFLRVHSAGDLNHSGLVDWRDFAILAGQWLQRVE